MPKMTNFERFQNMGVDELAQAIYNNELTVSHICNKIPMPVCENSRCTTCIENWLVSEVESEDL